MCTNKQEREGASYDANSYRCNAKRIKKGSIIVLIGAIILLALFTALKICIPCLPDYSRIVLDILSGLVASVIAGAVVTLFTDIPSLINSFKGLMIHSFTTNSYLNALDRNQLRSVKQEVVKNLNKGKNLPESLLQLDAKLGSTFDQAYYSYFNEIVCCHQKGDFQSVYAKMIEEEDQCDHDVNTSAKDDNEEYVLKDIENEFEILNPDNDESIVDIGLRKSLDLPKGRKMEEMFKLQEFVVKIDDSEPVDLSVKVETFQKKSVTRSSPETMTYDSTLGMVVPNLEDRYLTASNIANYKKKKDPIQFDNKEQDSPSEINVKFKNSIKVKLRFRLIVSTRDSHFTRRMRYSAQSFFIQYSSEDNVLIHGQVLGTLVSQDKVSILQSDNKRNFITIQCRDWLLPGNGIFIVLDDK